MKAKSAFQDWLAGRNNATTPADLQSSVISLGGAASVEPNTPGYSSNFLFDYTPSGAWGSYRVNFNIVNGTAAWKTNNGIAMMFQMKSTSTSTASRLLQATNSTSTTPAEYEGFIGWWKVPASTAAPAN